jgi:hypothetical protein
MKVLDLPDNQDNHIRQILLKQEDSILEELAKKSQEEIQSFIINANEIQENNVNHLKKQEEKQKEELKTSFLNDNKNKTLEIENERDKKFKHLKSAFPQSILEQNPEIKDMLQEAEKS